MKTIAFMTQKGGTGKTTLAVNVAVAAMESGESPALIDLDPQGSLTMWSQRRTASAAIPVSPTTPDKLQSLLATLGQRGCTLAVIDTQGADASATAAAMRAADLCLIPSRPSALDIEAARPTFSALLRLQRPFSFVLNQTPAGRTARPEDASRALVLLGAVALPFITMRNAHQDAIAYGLGVTEHEPEGKAAEEIRQLWSWIKNRMEVPASGKI